MQESDSPFLIQVNVFRGHTLLLYTVSEYVVLGTDCQNGEGLELPEPPFQYTDGTFITYKTW